MNSLCEARRQAAEQVGIQDRDVPQDGRWHDTPAVGKDSRNTAGRIKQHADGEGGIVFNHITGEHALFWAKSEQTLDLAALEARRKRAKELRAEAEAERQRRATKAAGLAKILWNKAIDAAGNSYLTRKGVQGKATVRQIETDEAAKIIGRTPVVRGEALTGQLLVVPVKIDGQVSSCQLIDGNGRKYFLPSGILKAGYWATGPIPEGDGTASTILLAEGAATALSCHGATGHPTLAAMSCGNLPAVATAIRKQYPAARLIVCSDKGNGEADARRAALEVGGLLAIPEIDGPGSDFNDLHQAAGPDAVRLQIEGAQPVEPEEKAKQPADDEHPREVPLLFDDLDTPELSPDLLPGWLGEYVDAVARSTQTPPTMAVMLALSTVATCTAKRFEVGLQGEGYTEPLNLWTATALPPANRKTAVIQAITAPLVEFEQVEADRLAPAIKEAAVTRRLIERRIERLEKDAGNAESASDRETIRGAIVKLQDEMPPEVLPPRLWTGDTTPERLQGLLVDHGEKMAVLTDEGGIFEIMAGLYNDGRVNLDIFLQGHAGRAVRVDRQGRTAHLDAPALSFGLAIQPAVLADMGNGGKRRFRGNGTLARFLFAVPRSNVGSRDVRAVYQIPPTVAARYRAGLFDLLAVPPQLIDGREVPRRLTLTADALDCWHAFAEMVEQRQGPGGDLENISDWSGKLPGAALRVAGNLHLVEQGANPPRQISAATMERALDLCALLVDHAKAAFDLMEADQTTGDAKAIFRWINEQGLARFKKGDLWARFKGRFTGKPDRMDAALRILEHRHIVTPASEPGRGRTATAFTVNPAIGGA
jgi:putative DNA primase/helicase